MLMHERLSVERNARKAMKLPRHGGMLLKPTNELAPIVSNTVA